MFKSSRMAAVAPAAGAAFAGTAAVAAPAYAAGGEAAPAMPAADAGAKAAHLCVTAHDQVPLYAGPHPNSGITGFLDGPMSVVARIPADGLVPVSDKDAARTRGTPSRPISSTARVR